MLCMRSERLLSLCLLLTLFVILAACTPSAGKDLVKTKKTSVADFQKPVEHLSQTQKTTPICGNRVCEFYRLTLVGGNSSSPFNRGAGIFVHNRFRTVKLASINSTSIGSNTTVRICVGAVCDVIEQNKTKSIAGVPVFVEHILLLPGKERVTLTFGENAQVCAVDCFTPPVRIQEPISTMLVPTTQIPEVSTKMPKVSTKDLLEKAALDKKVEQQEILKFIGWGKQHGISLVGINKSVNYFYFNGSRPEDFLDVKNVPNILNVAEGLYKIPEEVLQVMEGKTFYLSHQNGRGYTVLGSWPEQHILAGMERGSILEQFLTPQQAVHEFAHILDYHGIRGMYDDPQNHFKELELLRKEIFAVAFAYDPHLSKAPFGYIDVYSTANDAENFAQHFAAYILDGEEFRTRARDDPLLKKKYDFFNNKLFHGREY